MNPQPPVLETGALPIEPRPSGIKLCNVRYLLIGTLAQTKNYVGESSVDPFFSGLKPKNLTPGGANALHIGNTFRHEQA